MFRLMFLLVMLLVSGCATNSLTPQPVTLSDLNDGRGILVGSFSRDANEQQYYSQTFRFKNTSTGELFDIVSQPTFNLFSGKTPDDFQTSESRGGIFIFSLPPGEYAFYNFRLYQSDGYANKNWWSAQDYSIPFEVHAGVVNYVGEIKLIPSFGTNFFGMRVHSGGYWEISDQKERDAGLISSKHPFISMEDAVNVIPSRKEVFTPLVILPSERTGQNEEVSPDA